MIPVQARINGRKLTFRSRHELARYLMDLLIESISNLEARTENLKKIMELTGFEKKAVYLGRIWSEKVYTKAYWETVLSLENMGTLRGFKVSVPIGKGDTGYDPERERITTNWTIK